MYCVFVQVRWGGQYECVRVYVKLPVMTCMGVSEECLYVSTCMFMHMHTFVLVLVCSCLATKVLLANFWLQDGEGSS